MGTKLHAKQHQSANFTTCQLYNIKNNIQTQFPESVGFKELTAKPWNPRSVPRKCMGGGKQLLQL